MFFFWLIVAIVLTIAAIADIILTNLSDILSVLASLIFFGWTFFQTGYEIYHASSKEEPVWFLHAAKYLFFGCFFTYFPYACGTIIFGNAEKANDIGTLTAFIILTIMCIVDYCLMDSNGGVGTFSWFLFYKWSF